MAQISEKRRKKAWSMWSERRIPSEYEAVSHRLHFHFRRSPAPFELDPDIPLNRWYKQYREGSQFQVEDWEGFRDPDRLTYRDYVQLQKEREVYLDNLIDEFERQDHYANLSRPWVDLLEQLYIPSRFSGHVLQMVALYMAQMAPSSYITNAGYFQGADEMRRVQRCAYLAKALSLDHGESLADSQRTREIWEDDPHWQPLREVLEKLLIAYDWGESFAALNLVVKPVYDSLFNDQFANLARHNGDTLLALLHDDFTLDSQRSRRWALDLVNYAVEREPGHRKLLKKWVEIWSEPAYRAVEGLAPLFAKAREPKQPQEVVEAVRTAHKEFLERIGLD
ncbi:aromatic/alkene monooxygenase hydroxylase subunit beta [Effusibacillus lacus]|uniref:propane 2-monooxygenase n=1 Tax=Effusibacillus lacus TaxID=1348429 RepID=A0A292YQU6_9BACL|nr:aromatic/alkene monooxygenase hydroxylase subunit beta [Effusibacillus lacus]TCS76952.1 toluene 4-monooxygenase protein E [Effusibacillus lacus]GAX91281.1 toluene hydroxylase [Effusibacillus lacus]